MKKPKMIIFDYGQTLVSEMPMDAVKGTSAVLNEAAKNPYNVTAEEVQAFFCIHNLRNKTIKFSNLFIR